MASRAPSLETLSTFCALESRQPGSVATFAQSPPGISARALLPDADELPGFLAHNQFSNVPDLCILSAMQTSACSDTVALADAREITTDEAFQRLSADERLSDQTKVVAQVGLLALGLSLATTDERGETVFHLVARDESSALLKGVLKHAERTLQPPMPSLPDLLSRKNQADSNPLFVAAREGRTACVQELLPRYTEEERGLVLESYANPACEYVTKIFLGGGSYYDSTRSRARKELESQGELPIIELFLEAGCGEKYNTVHLWSLAEKGDVNSVKRLLQHKSVSEKNRGLALRYSASEGKTVCVEELLNSGCSTKDTELALMNSIRQGQLSTAELLLQRSQFSEVTKQIALKHAAEMDQKPCLERLLVEVPDKNSRFEAFKAAAHVGALASTKHLLKLKFSEEERGEALISAAEYGRYDCVREILQIGCSEKARKGAFGKVFLGFSQETQGILRKTSRASEEERRKVMEHLKGGKTLATLEVLLEEGCGISKLKQNLTLHYAAAKGKLELLRRSLVGTEEMDRGWALRGSALEGMDLCVEQLLQSGCSEKDRGLALRNSAEKGHHTCVEMLLQSGCSEEDRGLALLDATKEGHDVCFNSLFNSGCSKEVRGRALRDAAAEGHDTYVSKLLESMKENDPENDDAIEKAFIAAAKGGDQNCFRQLLPLIKSQSAKGQALWQAAEQTHFGVVEDLLDRGDCSEEVIHQSGQMLARTLRGHMRLGDSLFQEFPQELSNIQERCRKFERTNMSAADLRSLITDCKAAYANYFQEVEASLEEN